MTKSPYVKAVLPADWKEAIAEQAERDGETVSHWVAMACYARLPKRATKQLGDLNGPGKPKNE